MANGWNSPSIPKLRAPDSPVPLTGDESSWVIVIAVVGEIVFAYPASFLMDRYGRKRILLMGVFPILIGWLLTGQAHSIWMLLLARIFFGMSYAVFFMIIPIYLGEIASPKIRGFSITTMFVMGRTGILFMFAVAPYLSIATMAWISMAPPVLFFGMFIWMPESPYFLIGREEHDEARSVLVKLRGYDEVDEEFKKMQQNIIESRDNQGTFQELLNPENRKGLVNLFVITVVSLLSGDNAIQDYSQTIFSKIESKLEPQEISIILAGVSLASVFIGNVFVDSLGRKPLLLMSVIGCAICNSIVVVYFYFSERHVADVTAYGWLPILALMIFKLSFGLGLGIARFVMLGECFPKNLKSVVGGSSIFVAAITESIVSKTFQTISEGVGSDVSFAIFAVCLYLAIPFIIWRIPETKGKTLEEILKLLRSKNIQDNI